MRMDGICHTEAAGEITSSIAPKDNSLLIAARVFVSRQRIRCHGDAVAGFLSLRAVMPWLLSARLSADVLAVVYVAVYV